MADQSSNVLSHRADRRNAVRVLGAASTAVLAALGLGERKGEARGRGRPGKGNVKSDGKQRTRHTRHSKETNRPAAGSEEPAELVDDATAAAPVKNDVVAARRKRRRFKSIRVKGDPSEPLAATDGDLVFSDAVCPGGAGTLLGGGYLVDGTPQQLANVLVDEAAPGNDAGSFTAVLRCPSGSECTPGATIQAFAICKN